MNDASTDTFADTSRHTDASTDAFADRARNTTHIAAYADLYADADADTRAHPIDSGAHLWQHASSPETARCRCNERRIHQTLVATTAN
jgi:hypothetical protein